MARVSIVTPLYNAERYIADTMASVIAQTFADWEYVVVDDGSTDSSPGLVDAVAEHEPRLRLVRQPNGHVCNARNNGFAASSPGSEFVLFLDHDDLLEPTFLARMIGALEARPDAGVAYTSMKLLRDDGTLYDEADWVHPRRYLPSGLGIREAPQSEAETSLLSFMAYFQSVPSCCLFRRAVYEKAGGWDDETGRKVYEDKDLVMRCALIAPVILVNEYLTRYRWHDTNASHNPNPGWKEHYEQRWMNGAFLMPAQRKLTRRGIAFDRYAGGVLSMRSAVAEAKRGQIPASMKEFARAIFKMAKSPLALMGK